MKKHWYDYLWIVELTYLVLRPALSLVVLRTGFQYTVCVTSKI